jgi:hypothetical protein
VEFHISHEKDVDLTVRRTVSELAGFWGCELDVFNSSYDETLQTIYCTFRNRNLNTAYNDVNYLGKFYATKGETSYHVIANVFVFLGEQRVILSNGRGEYLRYEHKGEWTYIGWKVDEYAEYESIESFFDINVLGA